MHYKATVVDEDEGEESGDDDYQFFDAADMHMDEGDDDDFGGFESAEPCASAPGAACISDTQAATSPRRRSSLSTSDSDGNASDVDEFGQNEFFNRAQSM